jgi:hypothetical protein
MTERFAWLVERLYRANLRIERCQTNAEWQSARAWLQVWNLALRREHEQANGQNEIQPEPAHPSDPVRLNL